MSNYLALLNFNLTSINASTISYSTLIGSTVIASSTIIANSTINVSSIISRSINYSTIMGSTINANTVSIISTITTSSILATGNVGIGTNAPNALLQINSASANRLTSLYISTSIAGIVLDSTSSAGSRSYNIFSASSAESAGAGSFAIFDQTSQAYRMVINSTGSVGIGITNPGYTLHVVGSIYATGDITAFSDKRYKDNIVPLTQSLDLLTQLTGYSYTRSDLNNKKNIGLIAQEVKEVFPQAVGYDENQGLYSLNYGCLIAPVIQAIKELKQTVDRQDEIIKILLDHYGPPQ
jgi:hypothetical protein